MHWTVAAWVFTFVFGRPCISEFTAPHRFG